MLLKHPVATLVVVVVRVALKVVMAVTAVLVVQRAVATTVVEATVVVSVAALVVVLPVAVLPLLVVAMVSPLAKTVALLHAATVKVTAPSDTAALSLPFAFTPCGGRIRVYVERIG